MKTVTEILKEYGYIDETKYTNPEQTEMGTIIHQEISESLVSLIPISDQSKIVFDFLEKLNLKPIYIEKRFSGELYCGKPDLIARNEKNIYLIDWKTGSKQDWHGIQLWAYYYLVLETTKMKANKLLTVYLKNKYSVCNWEQDFNSKAIWEKVMKALMKETKRIEKKILERDMESFHLDEY